MTTEQHQAIQFVEYRVVDSKGDEGLKTPTTSLNVARDIADWLNRDTPFDYRVESRVVTRTEWETV